ncbi:MAG: acyltransferase family protein [Halanaerobium sp.]
MSKQRLYFFDNAKFILITLVLVGHFFEPILTESSLARTIYIFIYTFHMPAFIFIAGYFTKLNSNFRYYLIKNTKGLLVPYFIFQLLYLSFNSLLNYSGVPFNFKSPFWILWFLVSLFFWRIIIYFIDKFKISREVIFSAAFIIALAVGFSSRFGRLYSASRTAVFFPFFILGYYFKKYYPASIFKNIFKDLNKSLILMIFSAEIILIFVFLNDLNLEILYGAISYYRLELISGQAFLSRSLFLSTALINIFLFFKIVPIEKNGISKRGARSIYPYLLHGFIVIILDKYEVLSFLNPHFSFLIYLIFALVFSFILAAERTRNIFKYILEF